MTQEDKQLLLNDLCAKLPYGIKANINDNILTINAISKNGLVSVENGGATNMYYIEDIKPYLFPLSSMTEEQRKKLSNIDEYGNIYFKIPKEYYMNINVQIDINDTAKYLDWLNKNYFDYRGLINKGLAIDCTNLNIY